MATKGLVGGLNTSSNVVTSSSNTSSTTLQGSTLTDNQNGVTASIGEAQTYNARIASGNILTPVEYTGSETDSMYIEVDNTTRTISGEVKWRSMIATSEEQEDAYHAYPAHKARINFEDITKSLTKIQGTVSVLDESCKKSTTSINKHVEDLARIQTSLEECMKACSALKDALDTEVSQRELDHVKIRSKHAEDFNTLKTDFSTLTTQTVDRMTAQDGSIEAVRQSVENEAFRAKSEEGRIEQNLQATTRMLLDTARDLGTLEAGTKELTNRFNALESSDQFTNIENHTEQIESIGKNLNSIDLRLSAQINEATSETAKLRDISYKHSADITKVTAEIKQATSDFEDLNASQQSLEITVDNMHRTLESELQDRAQQYLNLSARIQDEGTIRRETDVYHEEEIARLEMRISLLQSELTTVIQNLANELRLRDNELESDMNSITYDFIDAGNAPI